MKSTSARRPDWRPRIQQLLKRTFGLERLRDGQEQVIARVMEGLPTLAVMPTGAGKSLCYQLPALLLPGRTVVVSPLIALMKDQCDKLREIGVKAVQLHSALAASDVAEADAAVASGEARLVFTTPERLADGGFVDSLRAHPVSLLVIDEAHCISQWGHDFRPAFLEIGAVLPLLRQPAVLALTATATQDVIDDVGRQLGVKNMQVVNTGVYRPNLHYRVEQVTREDEKLARALDLVSRSQGPALVYTATVKAVEAVHEALLAAGEPATRYHGRLSAGERRANQDAFMRNEVRVMVATNAFGLGIDKPDTAFVLHYQMPSGLDAYYQESGRAGRNGDPAECVLLYLHSDKAVQQFFLAGRYPALDDVDALYRALLKDAPDGRQWTFARLLEALGTPRTKLQVALQLLRRQGIVAQDRQGRLRLLHERLDGAAIERLLTDYRDKRERDRAMLERMVFYGQTGYCRWKVLLEHFDEAEGFEGCGTCDNCLRPAARLLPPEASAAAAPAPPAFSESPRPGFAPGDTVRVPRYGAGTVTAADAHTVTVVFGKGPGRCFLAPYVEAA